MSDLIRRVRAAIEEALPWFDRAAEERWKVGFERDLASSRATRELADEITRQDVMRGSFQRADKRLAGS